MNAEEAAKLIDNGWKILIFKDGLGTFSALAVEEHRSVDKAMRAWRNYEAPEGATPDEMVFGGPHRLCGCGFTVAEALHSLVEKVLFRRLPAKEEKEGGG
ncbi:MAG: hypothetical protein E6G97_17705 [Alphaproteobacteria bacterium]|nr:MAG: hypothetical protein E6G97_17705 [Alphaproteobacteria bacterium]